MKKNKSLFLILIFLAIFIVQPNNFNAIKSGLTQNDIPTQLNIADSAEEKNSNSNLNTSLKNDDLKSKEYDGKNQVIVVNEKSQFTKDELSLENGSCLQRATGDSDVCDVQKASKHQSHEF